MNKKMRELMAKIQSMSAQAKEYMDGDSKDIEKANSIMDEIEKLEKEFEVEKRLYETQKRVGLQNANAPFVATDQEKDVKLTAEQMVAKEVRAIMSPTKYAGDKSLQESVDADGGYTVPEDIQTAVNQWKDVESSWLDEISVENVSTNKGARTYQKKTDVDEFVDLDENGAITKEITAPKFERITYSIQDRAGFMPVSNDLQMDSDANISAIVTAWLGKANIATANAKIIGIIEEKQQVALDGLKGIKKVVNVTLGQAYKATTKIITNDDGLNWLDTLEDNNGRPLLNPDPTDSAKLALRCGATVIPVKVKPNKAFPTKTDYKITTDVALVAGKTYYTKSDKNYTAVESPSVDNIATYYEATVKIPMVIGDLKEGIRKFDRQSMSLKASDTATIGSFNAFAMNMTLIRAILRDDYKQMDRDSYVYGYIEMGE